MGTNPGLALFIYLGIRPTAHGCIDGVILQRIKVADIFLELGKFEVSVSVSKHETFVMYSFLGYMYLKNIDDRFGLRSKCTKEKTFLPNQWPWPTLCINLNTCTCSGCAVVKFKMLRVVQKHPLARHQSTFCYWRTTCRSVTTWWIRVLYNKQSSTLAGGRVYMGPQIWILDPHIFEIETGILCTQTVNGQFHHNGHEIFHREILVVQTIGKQN